MSDNMRTVRTPVVRLSYAHLIEPKPYKEEGKPKGDPTYNTEFIFDTEDLNNFEVRNENGDWEKVGELKNILAAVAKEEWGSDLDIVESVKHGGMKWPIVDGNSTIEKKVQKGKKASSLEQYKDKKVIRAKSSQKWPPRLYVRGPEGVRLLDLDNEKDLKEAKKLFSSGNYVVSSLNLTPNEVDGRKYLTFYLNDVMFFKKGDSLGGVDGNDVFSGYEGGESDFDPSEGLNQDIPIDL